MDRNKPWLLRGAMVGAPDIWEALGGLYCDLDYCLFVGRGRPFVIFRRLRAGICIARMDRRSMCCDLAHFDSRRGFVGGV